MPGRDPGDYSTLAHDRLAVLFLTSLYCSILWMCPGLSSQCPFDGHLDCFQPFAILNKAAVHSLDMGHFTQASVRKFLEMELRGQRACAF